MSKTLTLLKNEKLDINMLKTNKNIFKNDEWILFIMVLTLFKDNDDQFNKLFAKLKEKVEKEK